MALGNGRDRHARVLEWIAVDWGTSHVRAWPMAADGSVLGTRSSTAGMGTLRKDEFESALLDLVGDLLVDAEAPIPVLCCGMVGSRQGWAEATYLALPCVPPSVGEATQVATSDPRLDVRLLPGLKQAQPADVMRGEETQIAGVLAANPGFDGVVCLPGTHSKWVHVSAGEVISFRTFLTGEMFALLSERSVLRHSVAATGWDTTAFAEAVAEGMSHPARLSANLFTLRAEALLQDLPPAVARARLSGLLIGQELAGARPYWLGQAVTIVGEHALAQAYAEAIALQGIEPSRLASDAVTIGGLAWARGTLIEERTGML